MKNLYDPSGNFDAPLNTGRMVPVSHYRAPRQSQVFPAAQLNQAFVFPLPDNILGQFVHAVQVGWYVAPDNGTIDVAPSSLFGHVSYSGADQLDIGDFIQSPVRYLRSPRTSSSSIVLTFVITFPNTINPSTVYITLDVFYSENQSVVFPSEILENNFLNTFF